MFNNSHLRFVLLFALCAVFILSATMLILDSIQGIKEENAFKELAVIVASDTEPAPYFDDSSKAIQTPNEPVVLAQYRELYRLNADMAGWIKIDGTELDYPVMYTPENGDFYLTHDFDKETARSGVPFIDARCTVDPFGTNTIIYGHHMKNGTMFAALEKYKSEDYYKDHPIICFNTLFAYLEYEIIAVFESQIYGNKDTVFKHYNFLNAESKADFDEYIANIKALSLYDTGVTASYGDELLTLVTCNYHMENGQFVVLAKRIS